MRFSNPFGELTENPLLSSAFTQDDRFPSFINPPSGSFIITENGNLMITESGNYIVTE
jgi:hypothetical protein